MSAASTEIAGVERNAAGRFIDFSCSTDWEKSVLRVESYVRGALHGRGESEFFSFNGIKLKISYTNKVQAPSCLSSLFEIENSYILVSRVDNNWLDCTTSQKHTLLSVLVTALQACSDSLDRNIPRNIPPIFFTMSSTESIQDSRALDIIGYQICRRPSSSVVVNYSSVSLSHGTEGGEGRELRHVDGLSQLFRKHLAEYHRGIDSAQLSGMVVQVTEKSSATVPTPSRSDKTVRSDKVTPVESDIFPSLPRLLKQIQGISRNKESSISKGAVRGLDMSALLSYPPMRLASIVDNETHSTLVPARQPPHCWSMQASFGSSFSRKGSSGLSFSLSVCVRRLLVSFIHSKSASYVATHRSNSSNKDNNRDISADSASSSPNPNSPTRVADLATRSAEKAALIAAVLGPTTVELVRTMCTYEEDKEAEDVYVNNLLILLFQEDPSIEDDGGDEDGREEEETCSASKVDETLLRVGRCAQSTVELLSLYAVCAGSLRSFSSSGILWSRFLLVLRSRWDSGITLPGLNGPVLNDLDAPDTAVNAPLRNRLMWEEVIERNPLLRGYHRQWVVDPSLSVLAQKLKALQFCIAVKEEGALCHPFRDSLELQRRLPLTADAAAQRTFILDKLRPVEGVVGGVSPPSSDPSALSDDHHRRTDQQAGGEGDKSEVSDGADAVQPSQLQYWRVEQDVVISDMRAWKAEYLSEGDGEGEEGDGGSFEEFVEWYTGEGGDMDGREREKETRKGSIKVVERDDSLAEEGPDVAGRSWEAVSPSLLLLWSQLWRCCSPACPASEQKPLFSAEQEAEKALGYLGSLDPSQLASELLLSAVAAAPALLLVLVDGHVAAAAALVRGICPSSASSALAATRALGQGEEMQLLCATISSARREMHADMAHTASDDMGREAAVNQAALLLLDQAADGIERIEEYSARVTAVCSALAQVINVANIEQEGLRAFASVLPSLIHAVCSSSGGQSYAGSGRSGDLSGVFAPRNAKEAAACCILAQAISQSNLPPEGRTTEDSTSPRGDRDERTKNSDTPHRWTPTERVIRMWLPSDPSEDPGPVSGMCLSRQLMRASLTADSLQVCFRLSKEEHY